LRKLDLAYALNAYAAQGVTTRHGIVVIDSTETRLASSRTMAVALTRIADQPRLVIDSAPRLERAALRNSAEKLSALEVLGKAGRMICPRACASLYRAGGPNRRAGSARGGAALAQCRARSRRHGAGLQGRGLSFQRENQPEKRLELGL
jgi:hypothetical protein